MKVSICFIAMLWSVFNAFSQSAPSKITNRLEIGDTIFHYVLENVRNWPDTTIDLPAIKNKLVLIDFWAPRCGPCVAAFSRLIALKEELKDSLDIILISSFKGTITEAQLARTLTKHKELTGQWLPFPAVIKDSSISLWLSHSYIPSYVWLFNGRIQSFTSPVDVSFAWVRELLRNPITTSKRIVQAK